MIIRRAQLLFALFWTHCTFAFKVHDTPICIVPTPNSILLDLTNYKPVAVGSRLRYATCTGASWFHENYIATLNLYGKKLTTYFFDQNTNTFTLLQEITGEHVSLFCHPEALTISPDNTLLALINNDTYNAYLFIFTIDQDTHLINSTPIFTIKTNGFFHNVRFSPDGKHIACTSFDNNRAVIMYKIQNQGNPLTLEQIYTHKNEFAIVKTKGINFTRDGKYAIIAYALSISTSIHTPCQSLVAVHHFDVSTGSLGNLVCSIPGRFSFEDLTLLNDDQIIVLPALLAGFFASLFTL